jgi:polyisoprenoid-binding protein YceI
MRNKLTAMFVALALFSGSAVNAEPEFLAYVDPDLSRFIDAPTSLDKKASDVKSNLHYKIMSQASKIEFRVDSPIGVISASFEDFDGNFLISRKDSHKKPATIKVNTGSLATDNSIVKSMLRGEAFFDVEIFPSILFNGNSFEWINEKDAVLKGDMTIKNVTRQVAFYVKVIDTGGTNFGSDRITMKATANIKRSDFEIFSLLPVVSDNVSLFVSINASKHGIDTNKSTNTAKYRLNKKVESDTLNLASVREEKQLDMQKKDSLRSRSVFGACSGKSARFKSTCR